MNEELYGEMFAMEQRHWWFTAKHRIVGDLLKRFLRAGPGARPRVADLGCGCGKMLEILSAQFDAVGADAAPQAIAFCAQRHVQAVVGRFPDQIPLPKASFDAVLLLDVLEHLDDDAAAAQTVVGLLKSGGVMICSVPAYRWLWSKRDEFHQHKRRYAKKQFQKLFAQPGLKLELLSYMNTLLFVPAAAGRLARRIIPLAEGQTDLRIPWSPVNALLRQTFAFERHLLGRMWMPFGLSLIAVARKD